MGESQADSELGAEPNTGLDPGTPRSRPEPTSRIGCSTIGAPRPGLHVCGELWLPPPPLGVARPGQTGRGLDGAHACVLTGDGGVGAPAGQPVRGTPPPPAGRGRGGAG